MKTIKPFIDAGWYTVPLTGELKRNSDGTKTIPTFQKNWRERYATSRNTTATRIGGVLTGEASNIIAIDCDNASTYNLFRSLDPLCSAVLVSKGKGKECGTILYRYNPNSPPSFGLKNTDLELDYYAQDGFIYLPTQDNTSKEPWTEIPEITEMPEQVATLIRQLYALYSKPSEEPREVEQEQKTAFLAPLVDEFALRGKFMPGLFRIITPKSFRTEDEYVKKHYLHPNNVPEGAGSEYLAKVSCILGADPSIDEDLYVRAMHAINDLWDRPMDKKRFDATICDPMLEKDVKINGQVVWDYDPHWEEQRLVIKTKRQTSVEIAYDDMRKSYYVVDPQAEKLQAFDTDNTLHAHVKAISINPMTKAEMVSKVPLINVVSRPQQPFGYTLSDDGVTRDLNSFRQTPELMIINNPESYAKHYRRPEELLGYLEHLIPETSMREYLLKFLRKKFTTFKYSPAILYFLGVHGSGKDLFVKIIEQIIGNVPRPKVKEFLEKYNGWILDSYFVQLDEYGNQLVRFSDREEALGLLKAYTGKSKVSIRTMRNDSEDFYHYNTFILTANKNPLTLEDGDRRMVFFQTPNKMSHTYEDPAGTHDKVLSQIQDFCYYLATEVEDLSDNEYVEPPYSKHKHKIIADSMFAAPRLAYAMKHGMQDYLIGLAIEHGCEDAREAFEKAFITKEDLLNLYDEMTQFKGDIKALNRSVKEQNIKIIPTMRNGKRTERYVVTWENPFND